VPDFYFVFPRSEINELQEIHEDAVTRIHVAGNDIEVIKGGIQKGDEARVHYLIRADQGFRVASIRFNSEYDALHRKYEREGRIHHSLALENCPER
jgi:hypothetical protein